MNFPSREELSDKSKKKIEELKKKGWLVDQPNSYIDEDGFNRSVNFEVTEESKIYSWSRVYLTEEFDGLVSGDVITITYVPTGEKLNLTFATYNKKGLVKDNESVVGYNPDDDKKVICLMVDINEVNTDNSIPFLRTLFKSGRWYQHQLLKRTDLTFECLEKNMVLDYYSVDF